MSISSTLCRACPNSYFNSFINWTNKLLAQNISVKANSALQSITYLLNGGIVSRYLTASLFSYSICHMCCLQIVRLLDHRRRLYCSYLSAELQPFHPERARPELRYSGMKWPLAAKVPGNGERDTRGNRRNFFTHQGAFFFIYINFCSKPYKRKTSLTFVWMLNKWTLVCLFVLFFYF